MRSSSFRDAVRRCCAEITLSSVLNLIAESPPGALRAIKVLRSVATRPDVSDRVASEALLGVLRIGGTAALLKLHAVRKPKIESATRLSRLLESGEAQTAVFSAILKHKDADAQTVFHAMVSLINHGGVPSLEAAMGPLLSGRYNLAIKLLTQVFDSATELFANPNPVILDLVKLFSNHAPGCFRREAGNDHRARKRNRRVNRTRDRWSGFVSLESTKQKVLEGVTHLVQCYDQKALVNLLSSMPSHPVGLTAAEALYRANAPGTEHLFLRALVASKKEWVCYRYAQMLEYTSIERFIELLSSFSTVAARLVVVELLGKRGGSDLHQASLDALMKIAIEDSTVCVRRQALNAIGCFNCAQAVKFLLEVASSEKSERKVIAAAKAGLSALGHKALGAFVPKAKAKKAAAKLAKAASRRTSKRQKVEDLSEVVRVLECEFTISTSAPATVVAAMKLLNENHRRNRAVSQVELALDCASFRTLDKSVVIGAKLALATILHPRDRTFARKQSEAASVVFTWIIERTTRMGLDRTWPQKTSKLLAHAVSKAPPNLYSIEHRTRRERRRWNKRLQNVFSAA